MHHIAYLSAIFKRIDYHQTEGISYTDNEWVFYPMTEVRTAFFFDRPIYRYLVTRDGQTCDPNTVYKRLDQEVTILLRQLNALKTIPTDNQAYAYLECCTVAHTKYIYGTALNKAAMLDLNDFDAQLRAFPKLYKQVSDFTLDVGLLGLKFHFVKAWRKVRDRRKMKFFPLYALFCLMSRIQK